MASLTAESTDSTHRIAKQYRVRRRGVNGSVLYESMNDVEGFELLIVRPDGSTLRHIVVVCGPCMFAREADLPACGLGDQCSK
jgi:hypothetical protein